ncbi:hypothetical protein BJY52DRAFT_672657 [Lactarius psammicola]|nr:hypothetical protein BJY52DRAFT_672657 [Lactarius psammicola]
MSRSATVSTSKNPSQRPSKSAWARGPPQNSATTSSHSQSLAPPTPASVTNPASFHAPHPRSSSALGQGVSIKDGINVPRSTVKQGSAVTFGSIGDASAPISSSQASAPTVKPAEGVKPFDLVVQNGASDATKPAVTNRPLPLPSTSTSHLAPPASTPPVPKPGMFTKLFSYPSTQSVPTPPHEAASPASRSASIPSQPSRGQPSPPTLSSGALSRGQNGNPSAPPPSPVYPRPIANGQNGVVGTSGGRPEAGSSPPNAGPAPPAMPSPRLIPDAPPGPSNGLPPPPTMWSGYYYHPQFLPGVPQPAVPIVPAVPPFPAPVQKDIKRPIRIESQEQRENRLVEEKARENESEEKNKTSETFDKASEDTARREIEERELHKVVERKLKEEVERAEKEWKEAEERAARGERERKEADERAAREEEERKQAEERAAREARKAEEREKGRLRLEEVRARREAEEKVQRERAEQERLRKLKEEEEAKEAAEQRRRAEEEALRAEEGETEDKVPRHTTAEQTPSSKTASVPPPTPIPADLSAKSSEKEPIRTDTSLRSPEYQRKRPGLRNSHTTITSNSAPAFPSALPTGQHTEDINRISYPEGIEIPKVELNVNAQEGKFQYCWYCLGCSDRVFTLRSIYEVSVFP